MGSLYILIPVVLVLVGVAVAAFLWAVNNHQFDDLDTEGQRLLFSRDPEASAAAPAEPPPTEPKGNRQ